MPGMTHGAGGQASAHGSGAQPVNCAHLHSAFGPGCPYCAEAGAHAAPDGGTGNGANERLLPAVPAHR